MTHAKAEEWKAEMAAIKAAATECRTQEDWRAPMKRLQAHMRRIIQDITHSGAACP